MKETYIIEKSKRSFTVLNDYFEGMRWALKAVKDKKDVITPSLNLIHVENGIHVCTDGHRMHMFTPLNWEDLPNLPEYNLPNGNYEIVTNTANKIILQKTDMEYPDIWKLFNYKPKNGIAPYYAYFSSEHELDFSRFVKYVYTSCDKQIRIDFLKDAFFEGNIQFERNAAEDEKSGYYPLVLGDPEHKIAVVMPFKD